MACFYPISGYVSEKTNQFHFKETSDSRPSKIPCGTCIGCRIEKSRQWAIRCTHEAQMHEYNCFITLTYNKENLPADGSLNIRHFQLFMKRLRRKYGSNIRFYHSGEYGDKFQRPHYHACIFGFDFPDKEPWSVTGSNTLYISKALQKLWPFGFSTIGNFDFNTAAYVARYTMKKKYGQAADTHYQKVNEHTGETTQRIREYSTMSRKPGIGSSWLKKYQSDVYPKDRVIHKGRELRPPKYYDRIYEKDQPSSFDIVKLERNLKQQSQALDNTPERLQVKLAVLKHNLKQLKRSYES